MTEKSSDEIDRLIVELEKELISNLERRFDEMIKACKRTIEATANLWRLT